MDPVDVAATYQLDRLLAHPSLKAICFDGVDDPWFQEWAARNSTDGFYDLVKWFKAKRDERGVELFVCSTLRGAGWSYHPNEEFENL